MHPNLLQSTIAGAEEVRGLGLMPASIRLAIHWARLGWPLRVTEEQPMLDCMSNGGLIPVGGSV